MNKLLITMCCSLGFFILLAGNLVEAGKVQYRDCGRNEIKSFRIEPCVKEPCKFRVGDTVTITVEFVANHNASRVNLVGILRTGGIFSYDVPAPGLEKEGCGEGKLKCPLIAGTRYTFSYKGVVPLASAFSIFRTSFWKLMGDYKMLTCAEVPIQE